MQCHPDQLPSSDALAYVISSKEATQIRRATVTFENPRSIFETVAVCQDSSLPGTIKNQLLFGKERVEALACVNRSEEQNLTITFPDGREMQPFAVIFAAFMRSVGVTSTYVTAKILLQ